MSIDIQGAPARDFENPLCIASQEWTYGFDNTGTSFADAGEVKITLSDGRCLTFEQTPTGSWTAQLTQWAAATQAAADNLGLQWLVEPRFVDNFNPSNIDGTSNGPGGTPSGLPGAPDSTIAVALIDGGMSWRYVNIQICPGEPVPVRVQRMESAQGRPVPYDLTTAGAVLGPKSRFRVFYSRDKITDEPCEVWYIYDLAHSTDPRKRWREANTGEIPFCYWKDGDSQASTPPPESDCVFEFDQACDDNGQTDPLNYTNLVTRRVTYCNGEQIAQDFFVPDPADSAALISYALVGQYVDCATGEPIPDPVPPCQTVTPIGPLWRLKGAPTVGATVDWWAPLQGTFPNGSNAAPHDNVSNIFSVVNNRLVHVNGTPDATYQANTFTVDTLSGAFVSNVGAVNTGQTSGTDQFVLSGYIIMQQPGIVRDSSPSGRTGERGGIWIDECCSGNLSLLNERTNDTGAGDQFTFRDVRLPEGIHFIQAAISDLSSWADLGLEVSFDDGVSYAPLSGYATKPVYECVPVLRCDDSGVFVTPNHDGTFSIVTLGEFDQWHAKPACAIASEGDAGSSAQTARLTIT